MTFFFLDIKRNKKLVEKKSIHKTTQIDDMAMSHDRNQPKPTKKAIWQ